MTVSEFAVTQRLRSDRRGPGRWILSHVFRHKLFVAGVFFGALSNAVLAAVVPMLVGQAFDAVTASPPDLSAVGVAAALIAASQLLRGGLQLIRNFSAEVRYSKARRAWRRAEYRHRRREFGAARFYYDLILREYADTPFAERSREQLQKLSGKPDVPPQRLSWLVNLFPDPEPAKPLVASSQLGGSKR